MYVYVYVYAYTHAHTPHAHKYVYMYANQCSSEFSLTSAQGRPAQKCVLQCVLQCVRNRTMAEHACSKTYMLCFQKLNGFNSKIQWYSILLTFIFKFTARLERTKIDVLSNLSKDRFTDSQY